MQQHSQAIQYIEDNRDKIIKYLEGRNISHHDAEDILSEATVDVLMYYKEDKAKSVHLAINRQVSRYFEGRGVVAPTEEVDTIRFNEDKCEYTLYDNEPEETKNPEELLHLEQIRSKYPGLIADYSDDLKIQEFLELVMVSSVDPFTAADIAGIPSSRSNTSYHIRRFLGQVEETTCGSET